MGLDNVAAKNGETKGDSANAPFEFVITAADQQRVFNKDGSSSSNQSSDKFDPSCKNSVKTPDGSEQRFDSQGLCKVRGDVKWGKSTDGIMEITVGGEVNGVKMYLDKNWQLQSVEGKNTSFKKGDLDLKQAIAPAEKLKGTLSAEPPAKVAEQRNKNGESVARKPVHPAKPIEQHTRKFEEAPKAHSKQPLVHSERGGSGWKTEVKPAVGQPLNILPDFSIRK